MLKPVHKLISSKTSSLCFAWPLCGTALRTLLMKDRIGIGSVEERYWGIFLGFVLYPFVSTACSGEGKDQG